MSVQSALEEIPPKVRHADKTSIGTQLPSNQIVPLVDGTLKGRRPG